MKGICSNRESRSGCQLGARACICTLTCKEAGMGRFIWRVPEGILKPNTGLHLSKGPQRAPDCVVPSYFLVYISHLGIWWKCGFWFASSGVEPRGSIFNQLLEEADAAGPKTDIRTTAEAQGALSNHSGKRAIDIERTRWHLHSSVIVVFPVWGEKKHPSVSSTPMIADRAQKQWQKCQQPL